MSAPRKGHITQQEYDAIRKDRDLLFDTLVERQKYIRQLEEQVQALQQQIQTLNEAEEETATLPPENDYLALANWLSSQKTLGNDYYAEAGYNRSKMCRDIRKILGWEPDQNSLRKAQNKLQN